MDAVTRHMYQQAIGQVAEKGLSPELRAPHKETIESYVGQLEANAEQAVKQIEGLRAQVLELGERVPKGELERVSGELKLAQETALETASAHEEALQKLRAELEEAQREDPRIAGLAKQVEELTQERNGAVRLADELKQRESSGETVSKARLDEAQKAIRELEEQIVPLRAELEKASGEENPLVIRLKEQVAELEKVQRETGLKHQEVLEHLQEQVVELERVIKEDHPRQIEDITLARDEQAENVRFLQLQMKGNQAAAIEVVRLPHDQVAAKLQEVQLAHDAIEEGTPENNVQKAVLTYKMELLEAKQAEHLAIQKNLVAAHQEGAEEALRRPEFVLERQSEIFRAMQEQMRMDADILTTPGAAITERHKEIHAEYEKLTAARAELGDVKSQEVDVQLQALELDRRIAQLGNQLQLLETLQKTLQGFEEISRGQAWLGLNGYVVEVDKALGAAREEHQRLSEVVDGRDEGAIVLQAEKVRGLEDQQAKLQAVYESYRDHNAAHVSIDADHFQRIAALVPEGVDREQVSLYIHNAVAAIAAIQQRLAPEFKAEGVHHSRIEGLLQQIYTWNAEYLDITDSSVAELRGGVRDEFTRSLRYELPNILQTIVGYMQMPATGIAGEIGARETEIARLEQEHGQLDAVRDHTRNERAIGANRAQFTIENIYLNTLLAIQRVHQTLRDAHAAEKVDLEWQKGVLGTMQRFIVGFFSMLFAIPKAMIGGLQTMGNPIVRKPNN